MGTNEEKGFFGKHFFFLKLLGLEQIIFWLFVSNFPAGF